MRKLWKLDNLSRFTLTARDGEIGNIEAIYFDDKEWSVRYFIVQTDSWLSGRKVLVTPAMIRDVDEKQEVLKLDLTKEQIKNAPPIDTEQAVSRHYEEQYYDYYRLSPYWLSDPLMTPVEQNRDEPVTPGNLHLRSSEEVRGYRLHAEDGDIGHIDDFILESPDWTVRYLEVDTRNWLPSKHVPVSPTWLEKIDWVRQEVSVHLQRETIRTAPAYDPKELNSQEYQVKLYAHYGKSLIEE